MVSAPKSLRRRAFGALRESLAMKRKRAALLVPRARSLRWVLIVTLAAWGCAGSGADGPETESDFGRDLWGPADTVTDSTSLADTNPNDDIISAFDAADSYDVEPVSDTGDVSDSASPADVADTLEVNDWNDTDVARDAGDLSDADASTDTTERDVVSQADEVSAWEDAEVGGDAAAEDVLDGADAARDAIDDASEAEDAPTPVDTVEDTAAPVDAVEDAPTPVDTVEDTAAPIDAVEDVPPPVPPIAVISATPTTGPAPLLVRFDASGSSDLDGEIVRYEWDFEDDGAVDQTAAVANRSYTEVGSWTARLTVTDDDGLTDSATVVIEVDHAEPVYLFREYFDSNPFGSRWSVYYDGCSEDASGTVGYYTESADACGSSPGYVYRQYAGTRCLEYSGPSFTTAGFHDLELAFSYRLGGGSIGVAVHRDGVWTGTLAEVDGSGMANWSRRALALTGTVDGVRFFLRAGDNSTRRLDCISISGFPACTPPVAIVQHPVETLRCAGDTATLHVAATGSNLSYQWRRNGVALSDDGRIDGVHTETLVIAQLTATDAGTYRVDVTGDCGGAQSEAAALYVTDGPLVTLDPEPVAACPGDDVQFDVEAEGVGTLTYRWKKDGVPLADGAGVAGASTSALSLLDVDAADAGAYDCALSDDCGSTASLGAALTFDCPAPTITAQPVDREVAVGDDARFTVSTTGPGILSHRWQKDGVDLDDGGRISGARTRSLTIADTVAGDAGGYRCVVTNAGGSTESRTATLTVIEQVATVVGTTTDPGFFSLAAFDGQLYAGTYGTGKVYGTLNGWAGPLVDLNTGESVYVMAEYGGYLYANTESRGEIWRTANGWDWERVFDGEATAIGCGLATFGGQLYAGYTRLSDGAGRIYRSTTGNRGSWQHVFGGSDQGSDVTLRELIVYGGALYALNFDLEGSVGGFYTTSNGTTWTWHGMLADKRPIKAHVWNGYLWFSTSPYTTSRVPPAGVYRWDGTNLVAVYADPARAVGTDILDFDGALYFVDMVNWRATSGRAGLHRSPTGAPGTWSEIHSFPEAEAMDMEVFDGHLYVATRQEGGHGKVYLVRP